MCYNAIGQNRIFALERVDMALIKCPECGRRNVSDSALACPKCGYDIRSYVLRNSQNAEVPLNANDKKEKHGFKETVKNVWDFIGSNFLLSILLYILIFVAFAWGMYELVMFLNQFHPLYSIILIMGLVCTFKFWYHYRYIKRGKWRAWALLVICLILLSYFGSLVIGSWNTTGETSPEGTYTSEQNRYEITVSEDRKEGDAIKYKVHLSQFDLDFYLTPDGDYASAYPDATGNSVNVKFKNKNEIIVRYNGNTAYYLRVAD